MQSALEVLEAFRTIPRQVNRASSQPGAYRRRHEQNSGLEDRLAHVNKPGSNTACASSTTGLGLLEQRSDRSGPDFVCAVCVVGSPPPRLDGQRHVIESAVGYLQGGGSSTRRRRPDPQSPGVRLMGPGAPRPDVDRLPRLVEAPPDVPVGRASPGDRCLSAGRSGRGHLGPEGVAVRSTGVHWKTNARPMEHGRLRCGRRRRCRSMLELQPDDPQFRRRALAAGGAPAMGVGLDARHRLGIAGISEWAASASFESTHFGATLSTSAAAAPPPPKPGSLHADGQLFGDRPNQLLSPGRKAAVPPCT
jgi:hypothetical protein